MGIEQQLLASISGLLQGAASGAISRQEFDQKLREEAGKAKLLESQIRAGQISPEMSSALGKRAMGAGITGPAGEQVNPQTTQEGTLLQGATGQEKKLSFDKFRETERGEQKRQKEAAQTSARENKEWNSHMKNMISEYDKLVDNEKNRLSVYGNLDDEGKASLLTFQTHLKEDLQEKYENEWLKQGRKIPMNKVGARQGFDPTPDRDQKTDPELKEYLMDIGTWTKHTFESLGDIPEKFRLPVVKEAMAKRAKAIGYNPAK